MRVVIDGIPVRVIWKHNKHMYLYISPTEGVACAHAENRTFCPEEAGLD